jgi:biopolymer transport protein ExbD
MKMKQIEQTKNEQSFGRGTGSKSHGCDSQKRDELDMTPMVDVTFLRLIFFMVTASFIVQKSIEHPNSRARLGENTTQIDDSDTIQIEINQDNTYFVSTPRMSDSEAPSDSELRSQIKQAVADFDSSEMTIVAHVDSLHSKLVTAWDAGASNGIGKLQIQTTEEDF